MATLWLCCGFPLPSLAQVPRAVSARSRARRGRGACSGGAPGGGDVLYLVEPARRGKGHACWCFGPAPRSRGELGAGHGRSGEREMRRVRGAVFSVSEDLKSVLLSCRADCAYT